MTDNTPTEEQPQLALEASGEGFVLRLYIAGQSTRSMRAVNNLRHFIRNHLPEADVEIIDIYQQREMAKQADVIGAPTLVRNHPLPLRRIMGDLSNESSMAASLGLHSK